METWELAGWTMLHRGEELSMELASLEDTDPSVARRQGLSISDSLVADD